MQNIRRLDHLDHERGLPGMNFILCADAGENTVYQSDPRSRSRHERAHLRHQHNQSGLPQVCGLTAHVRSGDDAHDLAFFEDDIVGDVTV